jgi:hypothetical protein
MNRVAATMAIDACERNITDGENATTRSPARIDDGSFPRPTAA